MPDPLVPADPGLLASLLDTARLGGFGMRNLLKGNLEGAGRNLVDIFGRTADAALPGDWISDISRPEDRPEFRDVVDLGGDNIGTDILNFAGDVITDPVSYIPGAWVAKGLGAAKSGVGRAVDLLPESVSKPLTQGAERVGQGVRRMAGAERVTPETASALAAKQSAAELVGRAGSEGAVQALGGLTPKELSAVSQAGHNLRLDPVTGRPVSVLDESGSMNMEQRLKKLLDEDPELSPERLLAALPKTQGVLKDMWSSGQEAASSPGGGVFFRNEAPAVPDVVMGGMKEAPNQGVADYFPKQFSGLKEDQIDALTGLPKDFGRGHDLAGIPSPVKERTDWQPKDILDYLTRNPNVKLEFDAAKALAQRVAGQGELAGRAQIGQSLFDRAAAGEVPLSEDLVRSLNSRIPKDNNYAPVNQLGSAAPGAMAQAGKVAKESPDVGATLAGGKQRLPEHGPAPSVTEAERKSAQDYLKSNSFRYADPELRSAAQAIAKQFPAEEATVLLNALNGLAPRGTFTSALSKLNSYFKGPAIFGAILPKLGSITRNLTGGFFQEMANAEARGHSLSAAAKIIPNWLRSVDDGIERLFGARIGKNEFKEVDDAFRGSTGDPRKVLPLIKDETLRGAVQRGVLGNTFVSTEKLIHETANGGWKSFGKKLLDYPAAMFKGAETRMRYGLYKSLISQGKHPGDAARIVSDTFFDYGTHSVENRAIRDSIPFAQFILKAAPSQAKFLAEKPIAASALANLQGDSREPIYPWMQGKVNIPIGRDEQGNRQVLASLGLPVESISSLPNPSADPLDFGRQVEQGVVGSSQPLLKAAYGLISGREPFFGSQYGSYGKLPFVGEAGAIGRAVNPILGLGLPGGIQASSLLGTAGKLSDERTNIPEKIANLLTGAKISSIDESRALQQQLEQALKRDPSVSQYTTLYQRSKDDNTQELLHQLQQAKADIKAKKKALVPAN